MSLVKDWVNDRSYQFMYLTNDGYFYLANTKQMQVSRVTLTNTDNGEASISQRIEAQQIATVDPGLKIWGLLQSQEL